MHLDLCNEEILINTYVYCIDSGKIGYVYRFTDKNVGLIYKGHNLIRERLIKPYKCIIVSEQELKNRKSERIQNDYDRIQRYIQQRSNS